MSKAKIITVAVIGTAVVGAAVAGVVVAKKKGHIDNIKKAVVVNQMSKQFEEDMKRAEDIETVIDANNDIIQKNNEEIENLNKVLKRAKADTKQAKDAFEKINKLAEETNKLINETNEMIDEYNELNEKIQNFAQLCTDVNDSANACRPWIIGWAVFATVGVTAATIVLKVVK